VGGTLNFEESHHSQPTTLPAYHPLWAVATVKLDFNWSASGEASQQWLATTEERTATNGASKSWVWWSISRQILEQYTSKLM